MLWHWRNDPAGLPDDDHTRCMAAPGVRELVYHGQLFEMTTVLVGRRARLQLEHVGVSWEAAEIARTGGLEVVMDRCISVERYRLLR